MAGTGKTIHLTCPIGEEIWFDHHKLPYFELNITVNQPSVPILPVCMYPVHLLLQCLYDRTWVHYVALQGVIFSREDEQKKDVYLTKAPIVDRHTQCRPAPSTRFNVFQQSPLSRSLRLPMGDWIKLFHPSIHSSIRSRRIHLSIIHRLEGAEPSTQAQARRWQISMGGGEPGQSTKRSEHQKPRTTRHLVSCKLALDAI